MAMGLTLEPVGGAADGGASLKKQVPVEAVPKPGKRPGYLAFCRSIRLVKEVKKNSRSAGRPALVYFAGNA